MKKEKIYLIIFSVAILVARFSSAYVSNTRIDDFSTNLTIAVSNNITWQNGNVTFPGASGTVGLNISQANSQVVSLSTSSSIKGLANNGSFLFVNDGGSSIKVVLFNGTVISSHTVSGLGTENGDMAYADGFLYVRNSGTSGNVYMINLTSNTTALVSVDSAKPILTGNGWQSYNIFDMPDGRIGTVGSVSSNPFTVRLYTISTNGTMFTWSEDIPISASWSTDNHGFATDGTYLALISYETGHRVFSLDDKNQVSADTWNIRPTGIGNPTFITHDHTNRRIIVGDYSDRDFIIFNDTGIPGRGNFTSTSNQTSAQILNITNVSWTYSGGGTFSVEVSADNGTVWYTATNGQGINQQFTEGNDSVLYRVSLYTTSSSNFTLDSVSIEWNEDVDETSPQVTINSPSNTTYYSSSVVFNISLDENGSVLGSLNSGINNFSFSSSDNRNFNFTNSSIYDGTYIFRVYANDTAGNENNTESVTFTIYTADSDEDGVLDLNDTLVGNESFVSSEGVENLNITVSGNITNGTFSDNQEVVFYDGSDKILNFSYNFSEGTLNLSKVRIDKSANYILLNFSGQLQGNKTVYFDDDGFARLCVKDLEIDSISEISSSCDGSGEINFDSCIDSNFTSEGVSCFDEGTILRFDNLRHSGIRGSYVSSSSRNSGGGNGGNSRGVCLNEWTCSSWSYCDADSKQTRNCELKYNDGCSVKEPKPLELRNCPDILFDVRVDLENSYILPWNNLKFSVDLKEVNQSDLLDLEIIYRILKEGQVVHEETETIAVAGNLQVVKEIDNLDLPAGDYSLQVVLNYGKNQTASSLHPFKLVGAKTAFAYFLIFVILVLITWFGYNEYKKRKDEDEIIKHLEKKKELKRKTLSFPDETLRKKLAEKDFEEKDSDEEIKEALKDWDKKF